MAQQFGYAVLQAQAQTAEGLIPAANPAQPAFLADSACIVQASFFDNAGVAMVPSELSYSINDVCTGAEILASTTIANPLATMQVVITAAQNALISNSLTQETHQVTFAITDPSARGPFLERCLFDLVLAPGVS